MQVKPLTKREIEYATLATSDMSFKEISLIAGVTEETVKCALSVIYSKLGVKNRYGLIIHQLKKDMATLAAESSSGEPEEDDEFLSSLPPGFREQFKHRP